MKKETQIMQNNYRDKMYDAHERARNKLKLASDRHANAYDKNSELWSLTVGDWVWLSGISRKRGVCPKLVFKWDGPFLITHKLSDVVYRIQKNERSQIKSNQIQIKSNSNSNQRSYT